MWEGLRVLGVVLLLVSSIPAQDEEEENSEDIADYRLIFITADEKNAGTDGSAMLKMYSDTKSTGNYALRYKGEGVVFSDGSVDQFNVTDIAYIGPICSIELWSNADSLGDSWKLTSLSIVDGKTEDKAIFAVDGLVRGNREKYERTDQADGQWGDWSDWSECMGECPTGKHSRQRSCSYPPPSCGGVDCVGVSMENASCPIPNCGTTPKPEENTETEVSSVSIIIPIVIAIVVLAIVIAVLILKRRKSQREEDVSPSDKEKRKHDNVATYDKMKVKGGMHTEENKYVPPNDHNSRAKGNEYQE